MPQSKSCLGHLVYAHDQWIHTSRRKESGLAMFDVSRARSVKSTSKRWENRSTGRAELHVHPNYCMILHALEAGCLLCWVRSSKSKHLNSKLVPLCLPLGSQMHANKYGTPGSFLGPAWRLQFYPEGNMGGCGATHHVT